MVWFMNSFRNIYRLILKLILVLVKINKSLKSQWIVIERINPLANLSTLGVTSLA